MKRWQLEQRQMFVPAAVAYSTSAPQLHRMRTLAHRANDLAATSGNARDQSRWVAT
jgi:hypothetical protein